LQQVKYESDIKQAQIDLLKKDALLKEEELKGQRAWNYIFLSGLTVVTIIGFMLYYSNRRAAKMNLILTDKNEKINFQTQQLGELNATKDKLFSIISHDLRSPLASLRGLMGLLNESNLTQAEFVQISKTLKINLDYVSDDLDNLLNWARTQLKGFEPTFELNSLRKVIDEKFNLYSQAAQEKEITLENRISDEIEIIADRNHLGLIIRNLIGNAIKFSNTGGSIVIDGRIEKGRAIISIADTGMGMTEQEVKNLFFIGTHFTKPGTHNEKGLGIGLLLVKEFVEKNKGTISVTSEAGKGSIFTIALQGHKVLQEAF
jgi:Signal transduction histidine kinase